jgi:hypothetical protein
MRQDVSKLFNKFAGREVEMHEEKKEMRIGCVIKKGFVVSPADEKGGVFHEMTAEAEKNGLKLRALWPGKGYTPDYDRKRVNAHIEKAKDGKWRISNKFDIG